MEGVETPTKRRSKGKNVAEGEALGARVAPVSSQVGYAAHLRLGD